MGWAQISALPLTSCMTLEGAAQSGRLCTAQGPEKMLKSRPFAIMCVTMLCLSGELGTSFQLAQRLVWSSFGPDLGQIT